ncbi:MAG TPA: chalcone isomerase family protein [Telluria sp.]|nr:chalcone isomerase family protein [Telluria sp.]
MTTFSFKSVLAGLCMAVAFTGASAAEVGGIRFTDTANVAGKELKLNGAGLRTKFFIKVYAAGLYLAEKSSNVAQIQKMEGPRRVQLVMMRELSSEDFGKAFMDGLNANTSDQERSALMGQTMQMGKVFAMVQTLKKGDVLFLDWIPGTGTVTSLNGRKIGETIPDIAFYNALLRIWIGDKPADSSLKPQLLGLK